MVALENIKKQAKSDDYTADSYGTAEFNISLVPVRKNSSAVLWETMLSKHAENNPYWK
ncbi:hypothetical protein [Vibrio fluvialis]|uniref:hypothetical protein n=1 Tax=Vibrio fluvialis TaxID=676 RepID=UPI0015590727|nr:hypothetical protein [Vibrio fluvialis]